MLKYGDDKLKFDYKGNVVALIYPTAKQKGEWESKCLDIATGKSEQSFYEFHKEFLVGMGMPEDVYDSMQWKNLEEVTQYLFGQKKISDTMS